MNTVKEYDKGTQGNFAQIGAHNNGNHRALAELMVSRSDKLDYPAELIWNS